MAWSDMHGNIGVAGIKAVTSFIAASKKAKADRLWQDYNNKMTRLADAMNQNSLTTNEILARRRAAIEVDALRKSGLATAAKVEVSAAAADTVGRTVNMQIFDAARNTARAVKARQDDLEAQQLQFNAQRNSSRMQMETQIDHSVIPSPSPISALLDFTAEAVDIKNKMK